MSLATDWNKYRNHCIRVSHICLYMTNMSSPAIKKICIAAAFHDLGIWTHNTFDYIEPSTKLAREYLSSINHQDWENEIVSMIENHHKLTHFSEDSSSIIELFRRADLIDVSLGIISFGIPNLLIKNLNKSFPNEGFHMKLANLTFKRIITHPCSPFPMFRW